MAKRKVTKNTKVKSSRTRSKTQGRGSAYYATEHDFIIIVGGGLVVLMLTAFFFLFN